MIDTPKKDMQSAAKFVIIRLSRYTLNFMAHAMVCTHRWAERV